MRKILEQLNATYDPDNIAGMARFGIRAAKSFGTRKPDLRRIAKPYRGNHELARLLWQEGYLETRILAAWIDDPRLVTTAQMERWLKDIDSWEVCDQTMMNLFDKTPWAWDKALEWSRRQPEFARRAGFVLMATLAVHDKKAPDEKFHPFLERIAVATDDNRNFVRKAVNWALRQIGKRNLSLHARALDIARTLAGSSSPAGRWIGKDAVRELTDPRQIQRLKRKAGL